MVCDRTSVCGSVGVAALGPENKELKSQVLKTRKTAEGGHILFFTCIIYITCATAGLVKLPC